MKGFWGQSVLLVVVYWLSARLGLSLALPGTNVTPVWPPSGIALAALMLGGIRMVPAIMAGAWLTNLFQLSLVQTWSYAFLKSAPIALGNTGEAIITWWLLSRLCQTRGHWFDTIGFAGFFPFACLVGASVAALTAILSLGPVVEDAGRLRFFSTWMFGDAASMVLLTPLIWSWHGLLIRGQSAPMVSQPPRDTRKWVESAAFFVCLGIMLVMLFTPGTFPSFPFVPLYLLFPVLVWGCLSLTFAEVLLGLLLMAVYAISATIAGSGPFVSVDGTMGLLQLQTFMLVVGSGALVLSVGVIVHRRLNLELQSSNERLEVRVKERVHELESLNRALAAEINYREHAEQIFLSEKQVLDYMAHGVSLEQILDAINDVIPTAIPGGIGSVVLLEADGTTMRTAAAKHLPPEYNALVTGMQSGPTVGSCGAAIYSGQQVIVSDLSSHPNWMPFAELFAPFGLGACWSTPIRDRQDKVLGSFAIYFKNRREPTPQEYEYLNRLSHLAGIAVESWNTRNALVVSEHKFRNLYNDNPAMFFTLSEQGEVLSVNEFGARHLGWEPGELLGVHYSELMSEPDKLFVAQTIGRAVELEGEVFQFETRKRCRNGNVIWVKENYRVVHTGTGGHEILVVSEDITDIHNLSRKLAYHASHDALTGLINRRQFEIELSNAVFSARQHQLHHSFCYLDLDQFKVVNDTSGHVAGDELLRQLGRMLEEVLGDRGLLARLGGDEFGLILLETSSAAAESIAREIRDAVSAFQFVWCSHSYHVGVSIGIVHVDAQCSTPNALMGAADAACFAAKEAGRNRIHVYREDDKELAERRGEMHWVNRIPRGIRDRRFELAAQDIVPLQGDPAKRMHTELLIRYRNSSGQWVSPSVFLPPAERYGMATQIDRFVVSEVIELYKRAPQSLRQQRIMNINLSGQSLSNDEFLLFLQEKVGAGELPAESVCFEITETAAIASLAAATSFMRAMKSLGCQFALDDFGSGLSSFAYLKKLPVDYLKIDGMFVKDVLDDPVDDALVKAIHEIGHVLGKQTIAEFVENDGIRDRIRAMGIDYGQGYGLARPLPLSEWLERFVSLEGEKRVSF
jgi:diguanylate cyclase (GGDEF)-like protein/PAS domain S-box-containing protein